MREFLQRHRRAIITFVALAVPLFLLYVHGRWPRKTTIVEHALMKVTGPAQSATSQLYDGIIGLWDGYIDLVDVKADNERLRQENRRLLGEAIEGKQCRQEVADLRQQLEFKRERKDLLMIPAHVVAKDVSPYARVVRVEVDLGTEDGVREGMPVVTETGLVGRIEQASGRFAEVMLAVDARSSVNVKVFGKGVTGTVEGTNSRNDYTARLLYLHKSEPLSPGDLLVTSGHDKVFPPGIEVGYIRSLDENQRGLEYELEVDPAVNFSVIETVQVVVGTVGGEAAREVRSQALGEKATP